MRKILIFFALTFLFLSQTVTAFPLNREKTALLDKLFEQTGQTAAAVGMQMARLSIQQMTTSMKIMNPDIDQKIIDMMEEIVEDVVYEEIIVKNEYLKMIYPIYLKYLTQDDLKQMIEFNSTPLGKKIIKVLPVIMQEMIPVAQAYSQTLEPKLLQSLTERLEKEGIK
jgi:hypothetical protein